MRPSNTYIFQVSIILSHFSPIRETWEKQGERSRYHEMIVWLFKGYNFFGHGVSNCSYLYTINENLIVFSKRTFLLA